MVETTPTDGPVDPRTWDAKVRLDARWGRSSRVVDGTTLERVRSFLGQGYAWHVRYATIAASLLGVTAVAVYVHTLSYGVAAADTYPLIESSAVHTWQDVLGLVTEPLMAGTGFETERFYRPVASATFALDHAVWGLDPAGYHATNLALFTGCVLGVFAFARAFTHGSTLTATLTAGLFATHPLLMDVVPAIERRQDLLATLFVLAALTTYLHTRYASTRPRLARAGSVALLVAGFASKETALAAAPLFVVYPLLMDRPRGRWSDRIVDALRAGAPYLAATAAWMLVRGLVIGGAGVEGGGFGLAWTDSLVVAVAAITIQYASALVYPLATLADQLGGGLAVRGLVTALAGLTTLAAVRVLAGGPMRAWPGRLRAALAGSAPTRRIVFLACWLGAGWAFMVGAFSMSLRSITLFLVPFSMLVAIALVRWGPELTRSAARDRERVAAAGVTAVALLLAGLGPAGLGDTTPWQTRGDYNAEVLASVDDALGDPQPGTHLFVTGHADTFTGAGARDAWPPGPRNVWHLEGFTVASWLNLTGETDVRSVVVEAGPAQDPSMFDGAMVMVDQHESIEIALICADQVPQTPSTRR